MEPDQIFTAQKARRGASADDGDSLVDVDRMWREIQKLKFEMPKSNALPVLALGFVGGAIGAKLLKGTVGILIGGAVAFWAWNEFSK